MKKFINKKVAVGVSLIVFACLFFYNRYTSSPEYSLNKISLAYKNHDLKEFNKYVDTKGVITNLLSKLPEDESPLVNIYKNLTQNQIVENWEKYINNLVENGSQLDTTNKVAIDTLKNNRCQFTGVKETKIEGKVATITLNLYQKRYDTTLTLDIKMRDMDGYWQLFDISDVIKYMEIGAKLEKNYIHKLNEQAKKDFLKNIQISNLTIKSKKEYSWYEHDYKIDIKNISGRPIKSFGCELVIYNKSQYKNDKELHDKYGYKLNNGEYTIENYIESEESSYNAYDNSNVKRVTIYPHNMSQYLFESQKDNMVANFQPNQEISINEKEFLSFNNKNQSDFDIYIKECEITFEDGKNNINWNKVSDYYLMFMYPINFY